MVSYSSALIINIQGEWGNVWKLSPFVWLFLRIIVCHVLKKLLGHKPQPINDTDPVGEMKLKKTKKQIDRFSASDGWEGVLKENNNNNEKEAGL